MNCRLGLLFAFFLQVATAHAESYSNAVQTASVGAVTVMCAEAQGWRFDVSASGVDGRDEVAISLAAPEAARPPVFEVFFRTSGAGMTHVWTGDYRTDTPRLWPKAWGTTRYRSQLAFEMPLAVALDDGDRSRLAMAASEVFENVRFGLAIEENTCAVEGRFRFFTEAASPRRTYTVRILLDRRNVFWGDAVRAASTWMERASGCAVASVPEAARDPLYSTWYAYWQDVHAGELEREAALAASLGMKTMILDDGWQKEDSVSYYSATGDWMPVPSRFPDMKAHVAAVHKAGLRYMLWLSVPYVGDESEAWKRFSGKLLTMHGTKSPGRVGVLDPRFPDVREYLIQTYERAVRDWGFDGLKLDFIDQFTLPATDPALKENYAGRDFKSLPEAVDRLMRDVLAHLKAIRPDVLIEFRQHYTGPAIRQYGNMIRAADCPADPASNRKRIADLRLTSGETAVHADMLAWNAAESPEGAARPILNALFGVIQYSMVLQRLPETHRAVIRHWLGFTEAHRDTLQRGAFRPHHPELNYPVIEAESAAERIVAVYADSMMVRADASAKPVYIVNASHGKGVAVSLAAPAAIETFDVFGVSQGTTRLAAGLAELAVPQSGYAKITRK